MATVEQQPTSPPKDDLIRAIVPEASNIEVRDDSPDGWAPVMEVQFARYNEWTEIDSMFEGHFLERIAPKAFAKTFRESLDRIRVLFQHGYDPQIGDKVLGPIRDLDDREDGPVAGVPLLETSYNRDLLPGLRAGLYGASFRFRVVREEFNDEPEVSEHNPKGLPERTITEAKVMEFGPVTFPAYEGATAGVRSLRAEDLRRTTPVETRAENEGESTSDTASKVSGEEAAPTHPQAPESVRRDTQPEPEKQPIEEQKMGLDELRAELLEVETEMKEISAAHVGVRFDADNQARWDALKERKWDLKARIDDTEERLAEVENSASKGNVEVAGQRTPEARVGAGFNVRPRSGPENPFDMTAYHSEAKSQDQLLRMYTDGARRALEGFDFPHPDSDREEAAKHIEKLLLRDSFDKEIAQRVLVTGSPTYRSAFFKQMMGKPLSGAEQAALQMAEMIEARDMTTANTGGVTVPIQIDPTILPTSNGVRNPFRQVSRIVTTTSYIWQGVTSPGVTAQYRAEAAVMTDNTPTLVARPIQPERADVFIPYSWEAGQDWQSLESDLAGLIQDSKDALEATKFAVGAGHGSNEPQGVLVGAGTVVGTSLGTAIGVADVYALVDALPPRYQDNASVLATSATFSKIRQLVAASGPAQWADSLIPGNPPTLLGYPAIKASTVGTAGSALTSSARWAVAGDFSRYVIVDRIGLSIRVIPDLFGGTAAVHYPTGQSGLVAYWRNSAGVIDSNAFRVGTIT